MAHLFPTYEAYYKGYGLTKRNDGTYTALHNTPELHNQCDFPNIGLGWPVDQGRTYDYDAICKRIDEVITEREKRIGWVREFAQTCEHPSMVSGYLLDSCDPRNIEGHRSRSHHTEAELNYMWPEGNVYKMRYGMSIVAVSKTKYLYRRFLIEKGYIENKD